MGSPGSSDATLYHWVKSVYEAFGHKMPLKTNEVAFLGVREVEMRRLPALLRHYLEFSAIERQPGLSVEKHKATATAPMTVYDDLLIRVTVPDPSTTKKPGFPQGSPYENTEVFKCTIDAGRVDKSATRIPLLCEGQLYHVRPGGHGDYAKHKTFKDLGNDSKGKPIIALHIYTGEYPRIQLSRINETKRIFESVEDILPRKHSPSFDFSFCGPEVNDTIHIHFTLNEQDDFVGGWSTGCTVLRDADLKSAKYERHIITCAKAGNSKAMPYLVVSSKYLKLFDSSYQATSSNPIPFFNQKTEVLVDKNMTESGLNITDKSSKKVLQTGYTPSFATRAFFDSASCLSDQLQAVAKAIKQGKNNTIVNIVSVEYQKISYIKELISKKSLGAKEAATAEKWSQNLVNSLKRMGFYLPKETQSAPPRWEIWRPRS